jgi:hypothetical protein
MSLYVVVREVAEVYIMALSISDHIGVKAEDFDETGAFNPVLDVDSRFHVDSLLLRDTTIPELADSYEKVQKRFGEILHLLSLSKNVGDPFWRQALRRFYFPEIKGTCIGYSKSGTGGSGMGERLRRQILTTAKAVVDAGVNDPTVFELVGILEEGVGADRISDMLVTIIYHDLAAYSQRIFSLFKLNCQTMKVKDPETEIEYTLPVNPFNRRAVILLPKEILRPLPIATCLDEIEDVCAYNAKLRYQLNRIIGTSKRISVTMKKRIIRSVLLSDEGILQEILKTYKDGKPQSYDFVGDPLGEIYWYNVARQLVHSHPLSLERRAHRDLNAVQETVLAICNQFKDLIENNGLWTELYDGNYTPRPEASAQKLFFGIADSYCKANKVDISPEADAGRGPVDFKFSMGYESRVIVEVKLTTNTRLFHGYEVQLVEYQKAEKTHRAIFLVIDILSGTETHLAKVRRAVWDASQQNKIHPALVVIDGRPKASASKYDPPKL